MLPGERRHPQREKSELTQRALLHMATGPGHATHVWFSREITPLFRCCEIKGSVASRSR